MQENSFHYLGNQENADGAYIFDGVNNQMAKTFELNNSPENTPRDMRRKKDLVKYLPPNFLSEDASVRLGNIGTKTRLAIRIPHAYDNTEAFQIKQSAYGPLGIGKVTHFTRDGLAQEFFFRPW